MSEYTQTILTNMCLVENEETNQIVMQYRSPERYRWSGYACPGGHIEAGESLHDAVVREVLEETGLTIQNPKLVGIKNWPLDEGGRYLVFCYKATEFTGEIRSTEEGEISWVNKSDLLKLDLAYDLLQSLQMMEDDDLSEFYYHQRRDDGWEKYFF